ncbi:thiamine-monophosphate kinase [Paenibacillus sp. PAMC21692]|uniref:thiamine-phosphate kinase n=1 Tax=Paenibacillus sp. PAMC21692 TaxID=2762320 RepID=UPI00164D97FB|nr:thiamine-phosphate kinase [Paenibacillus sp. PAMC21692]QNK59130.1 thiamine-monophosphate kinase [Paenibacillus sp. PAMC21692]
MDEFASITLWTGRRQSAEWQRARGVSLGIGDDAAAVDITGASDGILGAKHMVLAVDTMVESVHFSGETMRDEDVGYKALAANVSDIAAMGGVPLHALVSVAVPKSYGPERMRRLYDGLYECAERYGVAVIGGDTTSSPDRLVISVTLTGTVEAGREVRRSGAKPGEAVFLTGAVGLSAAGLHLLLAEAGGGGAAGSAKQRLQAGDVEAGHVAPRAEAEHVVPRVEAGYLELIQGQGQDGERETGQSRAALVAAHRRPSPSVRAGRLLLEHGSSSLNDVSDGVASEAWEIAEASGLRLVLRESRLPLDDALKTYGADASLNPLEWMLYGGEDYVLLGTIAKDKLEEVREVFREEGLSFFEIGETLEGSVGVELVRESAQSGDERNIPVAKRGYNHFG